MDSSGTEIRTSLACRSASLSSGFFHVSHEDSVSAHLGLRTKALVGGHYILSGGMYRCQLGAMVIASPCPELQGLEYSLFPDRSGWMVLIEVTWEVPGAALTSRYYCFKSPYLRASLMVQGLRLCLHCRGTGSIPGRVLRSHMLWGIAKTNNSDTSRYPSPRSPVCCWKQKGDQRLQGLGEEPPALVISFCFVLFFGGRISQRVELSRSQLQAIGERVSLAQAKIEKIKGSKKAIKVASMWPCPLAGR